MGTVCVCPYDLPLNSQGIVLYWLLSVRKGSMKAIQIRSLSSFLFGLF